MQAFFERLDALDQEMAAKGDTGINGSFFGLGGGVSAAQTRKMELIKNYPIPTTKEDLFEFIVLAASHIETQGPSPANNMNYRIEKAAFNAKNSAWKAKISQAQSKAVLAFAGDSATLNQINTITKQVDTSLKIATRNGFLKSPAFILGTVFGGMMLLIVIMFISFGSSVKKEEKRLNSLVVEIMADIKEGDYLEASMKANQLVWNADTGTLAETEERKAEWVRQRESILEQIEKLEQKK
ncbi:hypothetical protein FACS189491_02180 [Spirochaetia bacterium]|nr:hypothetical protein FACS189491_02180 [Spirochaetia bacterium]